MQNVHPFWNLAGLTDAALLGGLSRLVGSGRQLLAEVVAHLGEVEERRLHLDSGYGSMFSYCVKRLGLSEDEACRRIKVARLARRYSGIYPRLASGQLSLSVIALLEPHLSNTSSEELLALASGKSVAQARELLASRFPRADVPSAIRKLPARQLVPPRTDERGTTGPGLTTTPSEPTSSSRPAELVLSSILQSPEETLTRSPAFNLRTDASNDAPAGASDPTRSTSTHLDHHVPPARTTKAPRVIEPLSAARYKIQLTADAALKNKLELARDLMRHTQPDGDFAAILGRALDLLIEQLMKRRFGARSKHPAASPIDPSHSVTPTCPMTPPAATPCPKADARSNAATIHQTVSDSTDAGMANSDECASAPRAIPRATRRAVSERDGLRCTWQGPDGVRCESRAWLENDHANPRGRGGSSEPENIRLLCRAHNQRAAELHYGRKHMSDAITRAKQRRCSTRPPPDPSPPPSIQR